MCNDGLMCDNAMACDFAQKPNRQKSWAFGAAQMTSSLKKYLIILREHKLSLKNLNVINVECKKTNVENSFLPQPDSNLNTASLLKDLL